jgi:hypothetical protein
MTRPEDQIPGSPGAAPRSAEPDPGVTGLPLLRSWRSVYLFVFGSFVLWVVLLLLLTRLSP